MILIKHYQHERLLFLYGSRQPIGLHLLGVDKFLYFYNRDFSFDVDQIKLKEFSFIVVGGSFFPCFQNKEYRITYDTR